MTNAMACSAPLRHNKQSSLSAAAAPCSACGTSTLLAIECTAVRADRMSSAAPLWASWTGSSSAPSRAAALQPARWGAVQMAIRSRSHARCTSAGEDIMRGRRGGKSDETAAPTLAACGAMQPSISSMTGAAGVAGEGVDSWATARGAIA